MLDDSLSAVDPETEHLISRALELVMVDRTVFIIAHRLSTVKAADQVIVLEGGRITQAGTHKGVDEPAGALPPHRRSAAVTPEMDTGQAGRIKKRTSPREG